MDRKNQKFFVDAHSDIPFHLLLKREEDELLKREHVPLLLEGGVDLVIANIYTEPHSQNSLLEALLQLKLFSHQVVEEGLHIITSLQELEGLIDRGDLGFFLSLEGLEPLMGEPKLLEVFYQLGVRIASLTWNRKNPFASGVMAKGGVTPLGEEVLGRMEDLGFLLDLSHLHEEGFWQALDLYKGAVFASHSNAFNIYQHPRNLKDDQIKELARRGGVIGLNNYMSKEISTIDSFMEHLFYVLEVAGENHVGLGFDFNSYLGLSITRGMEDHRCMKEIEKRMENHGIPSSIRGKVMGKNMLYLLKGVLKGIL